MRGGGCGEPVASCVHVHFSFQGIGDTNLAHQCFRLALVHNNHHAEAYNNLAVLEMRKGHVEQVRELHFLRGKLGHLAIIICYTFKIALGSNRPGS